MNFLRNEELSGIGISLKQEKKVIKRYVLYSIAITLFYALLAIHNIIFKPHPEDYVGLIMAIVVTGIFSAYFAIGNHFIAKNYITIIFSFTTVLSFFSFGGISGLFTVDLINVVIFTFILFNERSLVKYGVYYFVLISLLISLQLNDLVPTEQQIVYINPVADSIIFVFTRLILTVNMILYMKSRHNIERSNLLKKNKAYSELTARLEQTNETLLIQNDEVLRQKKLINDQNDKLKEMQLALVKTNDTLEERILERTEELVKVNQKLKKTLTELDRFVYSASHDLSAPLKSLLGLVHVARLENHDNNLDEHFNYIEKSISKQEEVITGLIQFSRNSRTSIVHSKFSLEELLSELVAELRFYPGFKDVQLDFNLEFDLIESDKSRLYMILSNLLSNAIKYRDVKKEGSKVTVSSSRDNNSWTLEVEDNGIGVAEVQQDKIFDMFYRANEESDGTGLGLFIVAEAVERLNGEITIASQIGKGTKFTVRFNNQSTYPGT